MNRFGRLFSVELFGESHGPAVGAVVDGCPAGLPLTPDDFTEAMSRRQGGAAGTTPRREPDIPEIVSGLHNGHTTGSPLTLLIRNTNVRSRDYDKLKEIPRPGHADFVAREKYRGHADPRGGGHFSGRLTAPLVAAGVVAAKVLEGVTITATLLEAGGSKDIEAAVQTAMEEHDSVGGLVECRVQGLPAGLGEPFFDGVEAVLGHALFSIPAVKGVEFGAGFSAARMRGSEHNDPITDTAGTTATNLAGGINGGITNGNELLFRIAVKPTSSIGKPQRTVNMRTGEQEELLIEGRHDACIALRVPPVAEAVTAITLADLWLIRKAYEL
jgi:chorismate synthase